MKYRLVTHRQEWNHTLLALPYPHVLQSWDWGEVKSRHGWRPARLLWEQESRPVAAAQVLRRPLPHTPLAVMYVPKGPVLDYANMRLAERVLADLEDHARRQRAVFVKVDPDVNSPEIVRTLVSRGWVYSGEQIQFRNTALLDLTSSEEDLLAAMKSKTRYNTRLAKRRGVRVRVGTVQDIARFYELYAETGKRDGFLIRPFEYYHDTWQTFIKAGLARMLLAEVKDTGHKTDAVVAPVKGVPGPPTDAQSEVIAGLILFHFGGTAWFMYGASSARHRSRMPNHALQWEAIRWAKASGCRTYDLWGAPDTLDERDRLWGVWRFKEGLGARFTPHIGAYDFPTSRLLYWAYKIALPRYLDRLRRHGDQADAD